MDPVTLAIIAAAQAGLGLLQQGNAAIKRREAQREFDKNKYQVPSGVKAMLSTIQNMASQTELPGADLLRSRLASTTAQGVEAAQRTAQSSSDVLGALHNLYGRQMQAQQDLAISGAQNYQRNQLQYANALGTLGQYQTQKWMYNTMYPYMQQMTAAGQIEQAGSQNLGSAIQSGISIYSADAQMKYLDKQLEAWKEARGYSSTNTPASTGLPQFSTVRKQDWWKATTPPSPLYGGMEPGFYGNSEFTPYQY